MSYLAVFFAQLLYTASDVWKKTVLNASGFSAATLVKPVFLLASALALIGFIFQMQALAKLDLSRTIVMMGMLAVLFSAAAGAIFFREQLNGWNLFGLALALVAIVLVNLK